MTGQQVLFALSSMGLGFDAYKALWQTQRTSLIRELYRHRKLSNRSYAQLTTLRKKNQAKALARDKKSRTGTFFTYIYRA